MTTSGASETPQQETLPGHDEVVAAAAAERRAQPSTDVEAADRADRYDQMMRLADLFDDAGEEMRARAGLGADVLGDPAFSESAPLSAATHASAEEEIRAATTGKQGLLTRSLELDADALVLRATVLTYRWIDDLQDAAYRTLGAIAGRAIGYLAPEVALGGAIVSAGLIETDALDRDEVASYLGELAEANPELMEHVTSGGGGLIEGLQMRSLLTAGVLGGDDGRLAGHGGLRAAGVDPLGTGFAAALRDVAGSIVEPRDPDDETPAGAPSDAGVPATLGELMESLAGVEAPVSVQRVAEGRYVAYLPGPGGGPGQGRRLRLVGGDHAGYLDRVVGAVEAAVADDPTEAPRVMLVGAGQGGVAAVELAAAAPSSSFVVDQVVTAGAPSAHVPRMPDDVRVLSLEDRTDPVALLGSLINAGASNRITVVFDAERAPDVPAYVTGGRAADAATHPELRAELTRLQQLGYLAS